MTRKPPQTVDDEWVIFKGGELEGKRPKSMCSACREKLKRAAAGPSQRVGHLSARWSGGAAREPGRTLCFQCYRADLDRQKALKAAGELHTADEGRWQWLLPLEPVNRARLAMLKADRMVARAELPRLTRQRRQAQIAARHALLSIATGLAARALVPPGDADGERMWATAVHAAELQLPESWLPFVVSRVPVPSTGMRY